MSPKHYTRCYTLVIYFLLIILGVKNTLAQDSRFSQYYAAPLYLNPALTSSEKDILFGVNYRNQGVGQIPYKTGLFSFIYPILLKGPETRHVGGIGFSLLNDIAGEYGEVKTNGVNISGAYNIKLNFHGTQYLAVGAQMNALQYRVDFGDLTWPSQISYNGFDRSITPSMVMFDQMTILTANAGATWFYNSKQRPYKIVRNYKFFHGFAISNLNSPNQSFLLDDDYRLPWLYKIHGGGSFVLNQNTSISPNYLIMRFNGINQYNIGAYFTYTHEMKNNKKTTLNDIQFHVGSWYRAGDSFIFSMGISNEIISGAISYDLNSSSSRFNLGRQGAMEVSLGYRISRSKSIKRFSTPLF
jgi:type IX secretion system PorP/SprF family membrane protein